MIPTTPSQYQRLRRKFSQWVAEQLEQSTTTQTFTPHVSLSPEDQGRFDELLKNKSTSDDPFRHVEKRDERVEQPPLFLAGQVLAGRFEIIGFLGRGGMGEVYEAADKTLTGTRVAVKTLNAEIRNRPEAAVRFNREVELAHRVTHPNICRIHDIFPFTFTEEDGKESQGHFLTMQLLRGESLAKFIADRCPVALEEALPILRAIASALAAAHAENVIHRDLKPGNIILVNRSGAWQPVITDFGLAALFERPTIEGDGEKTLAHYTRAGTPDYSAPEQLKDGHVGPASDIYSLGVVALEMLTGKTDRTGLETLPVSARAAIGRCLAVDPNARYPSAPEFVADLSGQTTVAGEPVNKFTRRRVLGTAAGIAASLGIGYFEYNNRAFSRKLSSISILPFEQANPEAALLGFEDELIFAFLKSRTVKLVAPYSTTLLTPPFAISHLAQLLPADGFLMGAVSGSAVVVRLFHRDGAKLWERSFARAGSDFQLHRHVVSWVLDQVAGSADATAATAGAYEPSQAGYKAYITARAAIRGRTSNNLQEAEAMFREALRHDGAYPEAYSGLGFVLFNMGGDRTTEARLAIEQALRLNTNNAEAHRFKGLILHRLDWKFNEAQAEFTKALDLERFNFATHQVMGGCLADRGQFAQGLPHMQRAVDNDPLSYVAKMALGVMSTHARLFDQAIDQLLKSLDTAKASKIEGVSTPHCYLGACWLMKGDSNKAFDNYRQALSRQPNDPVTVCHYIFGAARTGHMSEAKSKMNRLLKMKEALQEPFYTGLAFAGMRDTPRALNYLEQAFQSHDQSAVEAKVHIYCDLLKSEPRYQALLNQMHI